VFGVAVNCGLIFLTGLACVPVDFTGNTVLMSASLAGEDGFVCALRVNLTRVASGGETKYKVRVG
jgi:hypothetical protein